MDQSSKTVESKQMLKQEDKIEEKITFPFFWTLLCMRYYTGRLDNIHSILISHAKPVKIQNIRTYLVWIVLHYCDPEVTQSKKSLKNCQKWDKTKLSVNPYCVFVPLRTQDKVQAPTQQVIILSSAFDWLFFVVM